ncbi:MAG: hypothetical protein LCI00_16180 [Chloroflexi bacterium]|nr:hypothetical protein [Chloroflexota bacterium]MCC6892770.1 hypothetical protein [Anaerolineae bacterium]
MSPLDQLQPNSIVKEHGVTVFYCGVKPQAMHRLPANSEFTLIFSPSDVQGWEAVRYRIPGDKKGYYVVDRHSLLPDEITYFETFLP